MCVATKTDRSVCECEGQTNDERARALTRPDCSRMPSAGRFVVVFGVQSGVRGRSRASPARAAPPLVGLSETPANGEEAMAAARSDAPPLRVAFGSFPFSLALAALDFFVSCFLFRRYRRVR